MTTRPSRNVRIVNDLGLHLRAAGTLVQVAGRFQAEIWFELTSNWLVILASVLSPRIAANATFALNLLPKTRLFRDIDRTLLVG